MKRTSLILAIIFFVQSFGMGQTYGVDNTSAFKKNNKIDSLKIIEETSLNIWLKEDLYEALNENSNTPKSEKTKLSEEEKRRMEGSAKALIVFTVAGTVSGLLISKALKNFRNRPSKTIITRDGIKFG
ncbi:MAG: hypothetical protein MK078_14905 [Crocinitomicaceae bacterium]|nr:hypothetical protein [Crocinitomicaceae bacterium]